MARRKRRGGFNGVEVLELLKEKPTLLFIIPLILVCWVIERWFFSLSNWVPLVVGIWATYQYCSHRHAILVEEMESKWKRVVLSTSPITPLEHCEWLNKLLNEFWLNYMNPKFSSRFASLVEKRLKQHRSKLIERVELLEFSLGSCPPSLGLQGARWSTYGDQRILRMGFEWDTTDMSVLLLAKLAMGTARIVINSLHIKGDLLFMPILDGRAMLFSFVSSPEVRIGVAFGSGGSQSVPATELPGVSSWLVKVFTDTLAKTMVEPRRRCLHLPAVDLRRKAVGGSIHVTVVSASKLSKNSIKASPSRKLSSSNGFSEENFDDKDLNTFVEVEIEKLSRRTEAKRGSSPIWNSAFNMVLHEDTGILRFHLYNCNPNSVNYDHLASCEIKMRYNADDSTTFWAIGPDSGVIARFAEFCGKEVEMVVPFEGNNAGELKVKLVMKEWQFSGGDGSYSSDKTHLRSLNSSFGSSDLFPRTGRKIYVAVKEGKDLPLKERSGKCEPYVKLQYGKAHKRTRTASGPNPIWNQRFEFDEIGGGEYLKIRCHHEETFGNENIGSAQVSLEGLADGSIRDVWIPLEKVNSGELRLQMEAVRVDDYEASRGSHVGSSNGWIELVIVEARDLVAADLRGTSDPYVRVRYGSWKKRTKVMYKTLNPRWNQTLEFPDDGSPLELYVKDHNALLPTSSIGDCVVEYQGLPPNQSYDKWIPLQGVKKGEIHVQITRKVAELQKRSSLDSEGSSSKSREISAQMKRTINKIQSLVDEEDTEELLIALGELEGLEEMQEEYVVQLETEQMLLLNKIKELGKELLGPSSPSFHRNSSGI